jgi:hypothetical protein
MKLMGVLLQLFVIDAPKRGKLNAQWTSHLSFHVLFPELFDGFQ